MKKIHITFLLFAATMVGNKDCFAQWQTFGNNIIFGDFFGTTNNQAIFTQTNGSKCIKA